MVASQAYESDALAKNICSELASSIPGTTFIDWGHRDFDTLHIRDFQHLLAKPSSGSKASNA